jgi:hypothetical protein
MARHELDLLENSIDSFNEALVKYQAAEGGDEAAYKFAIIHFAHFLELLFKYYVTQAHPLLIYKNPFARDVEKQLTIGLWEAVQFLRNEGHVIDKDFQKDLEWLKRLRNDIEHHKFTMDLEEVRITLGRLTQALLEFNDNVAEFDIREHISKENLEVFEVLSDKYQAAVAEARRKAKEATGGEEPESCGYCGSDAAVRVNQAYKCFYCDEVDPITTCCVCGADERRSEMSVWNDEQGDYICEGCEDRISGM